MIFFVQKAKTAINDALATISPPMADNSEEPLFPSPVPPLDAAPALASTEHCSS